jgi:UMF1 family MFS transporter
VRTLVGLVAVWSAICLYAYFITSSTQFYVAAVIIGIVMGGVQSLSRSTYSKYLPENIPDTASYFSFYDVTEKLSIVVGLFCFGFVEAVTNEMRDSTLALDGFFVLGLIMLIVLMFTENKLRKQRVEVEA